MKSCLLLSLLALCYFAGSAQAAIFYVSPSGSDSNDGTSLATAFQTVARGVNQMAASDTLRIAPGTYREGPIYDLPSGTPQAPTIIEGTGTQAGDVVFDGEGVRNFALAFLASSGFTVRNLSFRNYTGAALIINEQVNGERIFTFKPSVTLQDLQLDNIKRGLELYSVQDLLMERVHIADSELVGAFILNADRVHIRDCSFRGSADPADGDGLNLQSVTRAIVERCVASGNAEDGFDVGLHAPLLDAPSEYVTFRDCVAFQNGGGFSASGDDNASPAQHVNFVRCSAYENRRNDRSAFIAYSTAHDIRMLHCVAHDNHWGFRSGFGDIQWADPATPVVLKNNVFSQHVGDHIQWTTFADIDATVSGNLFTDAAPANGGSNTVVVPASVPLFAPLEGHLYHVSGSPAIEAGLPLTFAVNAGSASTSVTLDDAGYFTDGYGIATATGDMIRIGTNVVRIVAITGNDVDLAPPVTWQAGDPVSFSWVGPAPDLGVREFLNAPNLTHEVWNAGGRLVWPSLIGAEYTLQASLYPFGNWQDLGVFPGTDARLFFDDSAALDRRIYRVRTELVLP